MCVCEIASWGGCLDVSDSLESLLFGAISPIKLIVLQQVRIARYLSFGERTILIRMMRGVLQSHEYVDRIQEHILGIGLCAKTRVANDAHLLRNNFMGEIVQTTKIRMNLKHRGTVPFHRP